MPTKPEAHRQPDGEGTGRVQSIDRAFMVLRELATTPQGATALDLSRRAGIERTTVHRLLKTLIHWNMVTAEDGVYALGPECLLLATAHASRLNVRRAALPYAVELQEKVLQGRSALVSISVPARDRTVIVERIWTPLTPMNVIIDIGNQFPVDDCASGKSILSTYPDELGRATLGKSRFDKVLPELRKIRQADGFCATLGRYKRGLASLAYPFRGRGQAALGAIVVSGLDLNDSMRPDSSLAQHLQRACENVSSALQHG
ncbi:HTH-type transcriptional regulator SrpS [Pigmentiphaga humi]|uniref:HTH-type transcriptional regulator SrpS n=1 Tax=Pigmentiphaga humi TaxID=2478468 RepID=A0A3P4AYX4_9BURK|nr:IclR family transcriptional regulator [Pigmentiphaga humi]VCU68598.1 HTH-type transcriptional regulator SrpS [Pigmentiphaga humi]